MKKKIQIILLIVISSFLTGCWSYTGLDEMTIVTGIAIDKTENDQYLLTFEVIDLANSDKQTGIETKIVNASGKTIFDAIRNSKSKIANKLYFSNAQIIIISNEIASNVGILEVIDFFIRDAEIRETSMVLISQEETASSLLINEGITDNIVSFEILDIISNSESINLYAAGTKLFNVVNNLKAEGKELTLPVFYKGISETLEIVQLNGLATFNKDKLVGYLTPEETKDLLFVIDKVEGGIFTFDSKQKGNDDIAIEITKNKTNVEYTYKDKEIKFFIDIKMEGLLGEFQNQSESLDYEKVKELEKIAEDELKLRITNHIKMVQEKGYNDIFGFGNKIYRKNPKLWKKLKKNWHDIFETIDFEVSCKINIKNTAFLR